VRFFKFIKQVSVIRHSVIYISNVFKFVNLWREASVIKLVLQRYKEVKFVNLLKKLSVIVGVLICNDVSRVNRVTLSVSTNSVGIVKCESLVNCKTCFCEIDSLVYSLVKFVKVFIVFIFVPQIFVTLECYEYSPQVNI
jgi:hypothetical protein